MTDTTRRRHRSDRPGEHGSAHAIPASGEELLFDIHAALVHSHGQVRPVIVREAVGKPPVGMYMTAGSGVCSWMPTRAATSLSRSFRTPEFWEPCENGDIGAASGSQVSSRPTAAPDCSFLDSHVQSGRGPSETGSAARFEARLMATVPQNSLPRRFQLGTVQFPLSPRSPGIHPAEDRCQALSRLPL